MTRLEMIAKIKSLSNWREIPKLVEGVDRLESLTDEQFEKEKAAAVRNAPNHRFAKVLRGEK